MKKLLLLLLFTGVVAFASPSFSQKKLDATVAKWQHRLKLDDYSIYVSTRSSEDLPHRWAESQTDSQSMVVVMHVLAPEEYAKRVKGWSDKKVERDIEDSIVHELVHVRLKVLTTQLLETIDSIDQDEDTTSDAQDLETMNEEVIVVRLTDALLSAAGRK